MEHYHVVLAGTVTVRLVDVVLVFARKPPQIGPRFLLVSTHAWCLSSCLHMPVFGLSSASGFAKLSCRTPQSSHVSFFDESGKASAANGVMLAPSERQRVSLPFFLVLHMHFSRKSIKKWTRFGCQIPDPKLGPFSGPLLFLFMIGKLWSLFGVRNLAPKTGPLSDTRVAKNAALGCQKRGPPLEEMGTAMPCFD